MTQILNSIGFPSCFITYENMVADIELPKKFTFPFYYDPHPLALIAANELQTRFLNQDYFIHEFGEKLTESGVGKMFGVLVVLYNGNQLGFLAAFSGKMSQETYPSIFVPPVFDLFEKTGFFVKGQEELNQINQKVEELENATELLEVKELLKLKSQEAKDSLADLRATMKTSKLKRNKKRQHITSLDNTQDVEKILSALNQESIAQKIQWKQLNYFWNKKLQEIQTDIDIIEEEIRALRERRKNVSGKLQEQLFRQYTFLNQKGEKKNLVEIFNITNDVTPPSGAGECAAPKLLQYAFLHDLEPICLAEFWWGRSPTSEIRKHGSFYPACYGKCLPILTHMLKGLQMDENPMLINPALGKDLPIIFEDEYLLVINKPAEFLSVPGKNISDSVLTRMRLMYPKAKGPLIVHRLDMSTSGLMLIAKSKEVHKNLQNQFIKRKIIKRYVAILEGVVGKREGQIELPLRVDLDDRPRQLVCYQFGKSAITRYELIGQNNKESRVYFYPLTGRTHQLRVHAAHSLGLDCPIKGDDLYGQKGKRLYLHAEFLEFLHPVHKKVISLETKADF